MPTDHIQPKQKGLNLSDSIEQSLHQSTYLNHSRYLYYYAKNCIWTLPTLLASAEAVAIDR
jgi:hypothetical protein